MGRTSRLAYCLAFVCGIASCTDPIIGSDDPDYASDIVGTLEHVPAGSYQRDSNPLNIAVVKVGFRMARHEVTRAAFSEVMGIDPMPPGDAAVGNNPVELVSWYDAIAFCNKLSLREGLTPVYAVDGVDFASLSYSGIPHGTADAAWDDVTADWSADGYRLPTSLEWMWAAMGAQDDWTKAFSGDDGMNVLDDYAWYFGNSSGIDHPVGSRLPNELGIYDMSGSVSEWCWDWQGTTPGGTIVSDTVEGRGPVDGSARVRRGGSAGSQAANCAVIDRLSDPGYQRFGEIGFRVARNYIAYAGARTRARPR